VFGHPSEAKHLSENELVSFHDGELSARAARHARRHLEACWECRYRSENIRSTILRFVEYYDSATSGFRAPHGWEGFRLRLARQAAERRERGSGWSLRVLKMLAPLREIRVATTLAIIVCVLYAFFSDGVLPAAKAAEILGAAERRQAQAFHDLPNPVVHQRLELSSNGRRAHWELWRSAFGQERRSSWAGDDALRADFLNICAANAWDADRPLSPAALLDWRNHTHATAAEVREDDNRHSVSIRLRAGAAGLGAIREASLVLTASDLHSVEQSLRVATQDGEREFRLREISYAIVPYSRTPFTPQRENMTENVTLARRPLAPRWSESELEGAEVRARLALRKLHADVDLTPQIERSGGRVAVRMLVDNERERRDIAAALSAIQQVAAQIWTPETAPRSFRFSEGAGPESNILHRTEPARLDDLTKCLGSSEAAAEYVDGVHVRVRALLVPALALERLAQRYSGSAYLKVPAEDRVALDSIAAEYLSDIERRSAGLKDLLLPPFQACFPGETEPPVAANTAETWRIAGLRLARETRDLDAAFNLLFTTQVSGRASALTSPQAIDRVSRLVSSLQ